MGYGAANRKAYELSWLQAVALCGIATGLLCRSAQRSAYAPSPDEGGSTPLHSATATIRGKLTDAKAHPQPLRAPILEMMMKRLLDGIAVLLALVLAAPGLVLAQGQAGQKYPDVLRVSVKAQGEGRFDFDVTIASPYDTPQRYADAFRVTGEGGVIYGERVLLHDHAGEQPFTRDLYGVSIPASVRAVVVQARDSRYGYGGKSVRADLPGR